MSSAFCRIERNSKRLMKIVVTDNERHTVKKVDQWTLGLACAGAIAFATVCAIASKADPPAAQVAVVASSHEVASSADTLAENTSPPVAVVVSKEVATVAVEGRIVGPNLGAVTGKEVAVTGPQLAAGVISFYPVAGTQNYVTVAHKLPQPLAIPISVVVAS